MVALQLPRRALSLLSAYFTVCILIRVARSQQSVCQVGDLTNDESCYNEGEVICNNYTDTNHSCLPRTINGLSYDANAAEYTVAYGDDLPYNENSFEVVSLQLCHEKALEVTLNDLTCGRKCTSRKDQYIQKSFLFSCSNLSNLIKVGLTIVLFKNIPENPSCSDKKIKFVVIDTRGLKTIVTLKFYVIDHLLQM